MSATPYYVHSGTLPHWFEPIISGAVNLTNQAHELMGAGREHDAIITLSEAEDAWAEIAQDVYDLRREVSASFVC